MHIVSSTYFLRRLRNLEFFTLDLGQTRKIPGKDVFRKLDDFSIKYRTLYNTDIMKFGRIGERIIFYEDVRLPINKYTIFNKEDIYEIEYQDDDLIDLQGYILDILMKIDNYGESETKMADAINREQQSSEFWVAHDAQNKGKEYLINQTLSKEQYRAELAKRIESNK